MQTPNEHHHHQQQQQQQYVQLTNVTQSVIVVQQPVKPVSKFAANFWLKGSQLFGVLTTFMGLLCVCGALTESIYIGQETEVSNEAYSGNDYSGYWCGFIIIAASTIPTLVGFCHIDAMIVSNVLGSLVAVVFASTLIALTADLFQYSNDIDTVLLAAYGIMVGAASLTLPVTVANAVICLKAIFCRNRPMESNVINVQTAPVQQQQQQ